MSCQLEAVRVHPDSFTSFDNADKMARTTKCSHDVDTTDYTEAAEL